MAPAIDGEGLAQGHRRQLVLLFASGAIPCDAAAVTTDPAPAADPAADPAAQRHAKSAGPGERAGTPAVEERKLTRDVWMRALVVTLLGAFWTTFFWYQPARQWTVWDEFWRVTDHWLYTYLGVKGTWRWVMRSAIFVVIPVLGLWLAGKPPTALGMGRITDKGWRIVAFAFVLAVPALILLGLDDDMQKYYRHMFAAKNFDRVIANAIVILFEHVFIEGLVLAIALPGTGFHGLPPEPERTGRLAWLGFGYVDGAPQTWATWFGVPAWAWPALLGQALIFGLVHVGKAPSELISAFPGGLGLGLLTWRIRTVWPSVLLHVGTGATILGVAYLAYRVRTGG